MKASVIDFDRIEVGVLGNCRTVLRGIPELAADIEERGLLQNLVVWHQRIKSRAPHVLPDGREVWDRYILLAGNRRHAAISHLRESDPSAFARIPVALFVGNEDDALFAQLAENLQREDLTPLDVAGAILSMKHRGHSQKTIAQRLGRSSAYVSRLVKVRTSCAAPVLEALGDGKIPLEVAVGFADLEEPRQVKALERYLAKLATGDKAGARAGAQRDAGKPRRVSPKVIRERDAWLESFRNRKHIKPASQERIDFAREVIAWTQGGPWPSSLPVPE